MRKSNEPFYNMLAVRMGRSIAVLAALVAGAMAPALRAQTFLGPHADLGCGQCHVVDSLDSPVMPVQLLMEQDVVCNACHEDVLGSAHASGHPSGFTPARLLSPGYPLDADGRFTCSSCHGVHADTPQLLRSGGSWACQDCH